MRRKLNRGCAEYDHGHLAWPFFQTSSIRELAGALLQLVRQHCPPFSGRSRPEQYAESALVRKLGNSGFLKLCVSDGDRRPDVRSLAIAREILAYHSALFDFVFAMQGLGSGAISLFGTIEQKRKWLPKGSRAERRSQPSR